MSSLKKDIEEVLLEFRADYITSERATTQIINLIESVLPEKRSSYSDLSERYDWGSGHREGYTKGYDQCIDDIKSKLIGKE